MNSEIKNITNNAISLFVKKNGVEQKVTIPGGHSIVVDTYETKTIIIFKKKGIITMVPAQLFTSDSFHILEEVSKTIDETGDSNNDEPMDHFHTTQTHEVSMVHAIVPDSILELKGDLTIVPTSLEVVEDEVKQYIEDGYIKGAWTDEDIDFLKKYYPTKGRTYCSVHLNRNETSVQKKINSLGIKKKKKKK